jgi:hypothetical protein
MKAQNLETQELEPMPEPELEPAGTVLGRIQYRLSLFELIWILSIKRLTDCRSQSSQDRLWTPARVDGVLQKTRRREMWAVSDSGYLVLASGSFAARCSVVKCTYSVCYGLDHPGWIWTELWRIRCGGALIVSWRIRAGGLCCGISGLLMISMHCSV